MHLLFLGRADAREDMSEWSESLQECPLLEKLVFYMHVHQIEFFADELLSIHGALLRRLDLIIDTSKIAEDPDYLEDLTEPFLDHSHFPMLQDLNILVRAKDVSGTLPDPDRDKSHIFRSVEARGIRVRLLCTSVVSLHVLDKFG